MNKLRLMICWCCNRLIKQNKGKTHTQNTFRLNCSNMMMTKKTSWYENINILIHFLTLSVMNICSQRFSPGFLVCFPLFIIVLGPDAGQCCDQQH